MRSPRPTREFLNEAIRFALGDSITISRLHVDEDIWTVEWEPDRIRQMILEMAARAGVTIPEGAAVEVEAINQSIGRNEVPLLEAGEYVRLSIIDRGSVGEYPPKIPDPYFTHGEKRTDKIIRPGHFGVYSISTKYDGRSGLDPQVDLEKVFNIYLPALTKMPETRFDKRAGSSAAKGRVLLMDDEDMIRDMAGQMLNYIGYEVELARAGGEAIELYRDARRKDKPFDVVILDLTIRGGMGGKETAKALVEMDPTVKVILSSGEAVDTAISHFHRYGFRALLPKPYTMQDLIKVLREVLN